MNTPHTPNEKWAEAAVRALLARVLTRIAKDFASAARGYL